MTKTAIKALLAGSILATGVTSFAFAQDSTLTTNSAVALTPPVSTQLETDVEVDGDIDVDTETKTEAQTETEFDQDDTIIIQSNEEVMGAVESEDDYVWEQDIDSTRIDDDIVDDLEPYESEIDIDTDSDLDANIESDDFDPDFDADLESETDVDLDTPE